MTESNDEIGITRTVVQTGLVIVCIAISTWTGTVDKLYVLCVNNWSSTTCLRPNGWCWAARKEICCSEKLEDREV